MKHRVLVSVLLAIVLVFFLFHSSAFAKESIRIGFSISLTGIYSQAAVSQFNAYQLWKDDVNGKGGIFLKDLGKKLPVEFVYYDDKSSADTAVKVYEKLITKDKIDLIFTPWGATIHFAVVPLAGRYKMPMIGNTASSIQLRKMAHPYIWFVTPIYWDRLAATTVPFLQSLNIKKVAIIYVQDLAPRECLQFMKRELEKVKIDIVLLRDYPIGVKDMTTLLTNIKSKNPEALLSLSYPADSFLITKQAQGIMLNPPLFYALIGPSIAAYGHVFGEATEGIATMGYWSPEAGWPGAKEFEARYKKKWKIRPDYLDSIETYISCQIMEQAIERAGSLDREKIRDIIAGEEFSTITGPVRFTGIENLVTPPGVLQYQKGNLELVWPPNSATAKPIYPKPPWPKQK